MPMQLNRPAHTTGANRINVMSKARKADEKRTAKPSQGTQKLSHRENGVLHTATEAKTYWTNREVVRFHLYNPNGYAALLGDENTVKMLNSYLEQRKISTNQLGMALAMCGSQYNQQKENEQ